MDNEVGKTKKNNTGIIIAVVVVVIVLVVGAFFLLKDNGETVVDNKLDETTKNLVLSYVGIDQDGKPNGFNDDVVARGISGDNYNIKEFINEYATVNNMFETEEYFNDEVEGCENDNDNDGITRKCFLLSKEKFNKITSDYNFDYDFDDLEDEYKIDGKYVYKYRIAVSLTFSEYKYVINSAIYEDEAKTKIVLDTTREETDLETNVKTTNVIKFYLIKNGDKILFDKVEVISE